MHVRRGIRDHSSEWWRLQRPCDTVSRLDGRTGGRFRAEPPRHAMSMGSTSAIEEVSPMIGLLARNWGWIALRGVAAILFGALSIARPGITLAVLVLFWGAYALADGVFALIAAFRIREDNKPMWPLLLVGVIGIAAGVLTLIYPGITATVLLAVIAAWAI